VIRLEKMKDETSDKNRRIGIATVLVRLRIRMSYFSQLLHAFCERAFSIAHGKDFRRIMGPRCRPLRRAFIRIRGAREF